MGRDESIHIKRSDFMKLLEGFEKDGYIRMKAKYQFVDLLFQKASSLAPTTRKINITNDRLEKKVTMLTSSIKGDALTFAKILVMTRKRRKHVGIQIIKEGSREWLMLKEVTKLANDFAEAWELPKKEAYTEYINIALEKMVKFSINKINSMHQSICETYEAKELMRTDNNLAITERALQYYNEKVNARIDFAIDYRKQPDKYMHFIEVAQICVNKGVTPEVYIEAQFEAFSYRDGIPDPAQMVNAKAEERLQKYLYENKPKIQEVEQSTIDFNAIKKLK